MTSCGYERDAAPGRWTRAIAMAILIAGPFLAYANTWHAPFVFDDLPSIIENPSIRQLWPLTVPLSPPSQFGLTVSGRPMLNLSLAINYAISGTDPWSYRLLNAVIHLGAGLLLFGAVRRIALGPVLGARLAGRAWWLAWSLALLWLMHPLQTESVTYVVQRAESLMGFFFLLTLYGFTRSVAAARPAAWRAAAVAACAAGMACKEVMVAAPLVVFLADRTFFAGGFVAAWQCRRGLHLALASTWILLAGLVVSTGGDRGGTFGVESLGAWWSYELGQLEALARYLGLAVWPHPLVFDYGMAPPHDPALILGYASVVVGLAAATAFALRRWPVPGFCGACFFILLAPTSLVPGKLQMIVEHRMYLPLAAILAPLVGVVHLRAGRYAVPVFAAVAVAGGTATWARNRDYASAEVLWADTVAKRPGSALAQANLGAMHDRAGRLDEAIVHYRRARDLDPGMPNAHYNLGLAMERRGDLGAAEESYRAAVAAVPRHAPALIKLGSLCLRTGRAEEAIARLQTVISFNPEAVEAWSLLAAALGEAGRREEALALLDQEVARRPGVAPLRAARASVLDALGRTTEALREYDEALRLDPALADAHFGRGALRSAAGDRAGAMHDYGMAIRQAPAHPAARLNLGIMLAQEGRLREAAAMLEETARVAPALPEAHANLGIVYGELGRLADAVAALEAALRVRPSYAIAHYNLGNTLIRLGRLPEARLHFEEALRLDPRLDAAREMLVRFPAAP